MLIVKSPPVVFVHVPKTGGKSVSKALSQSAGIVNSLEFNPYKGKSEHRAHMSAHEIRWSIGAENYDRSFSFGVIREPVDWAVSFYYYSKRRLTADPFGSLRAFLMWLMDPEQIELPECDLPDVDAIAWLRSKRGQLWYFDAPVDCILKFEQLEAGVESVFAHVGLEFDGLPVVNTSKRPKKKYAGLSKDWQNRIRRFYAKEMALSMHGLNVDGEGRYVHNEERRVMRYGFRA